MAPRHKRNLLVLTFYLSTVIKSSEFASLVFITLVCIILIPKIPISGSSTIIIQMKKVLHRNNGLISSKIATQNVYQKQNEI